MAGEAAEAGEAAGGAAGLAPTGAEVGFAGAAVGDGAEGAHAAAMRAEVSASPRANDRPGMCFLWIGPNYARRRGHCTVPIMRLSGEASQPATPNSNEGVPTLWRSHPSLLEQFSAYKRFHAEQAEHPSLKAVGCPIRPHAYF